MCFRVLGWAMIVAPAAWTHSLPSVWSQCQWVLTRYFGAGTPIPSRADRILSFEIAMPASTISALCGSARTRMLPPDPSSRWTLPRSGCSFTSDVAASSLMILNGLSRAAAAEDTRSSRMTCLMVLTFSLSIGFLFPWTRKSNSRAVDFAFRWPGDRSAGGRAHFDLASSRAGGPRAYERQPVNAGEQLEVLRRIATQMTISRDVGEVLRTITNAPVTTASAVHSLSTRRARPMIRVNCGALPIDLVESELFGHERGAFTSAHARRIGRFELADKSTLFLDEVGELPAEAQPALLRVLEAGEFERIGGAQPVRVDVRVIAATNRDLTTAGGRGSFREDLFYRLSVFPIRVPPLRERPEDIPHLVEHLLVRLNASSTSRFPGSRQASWTACSVTPGRATSASSETFSSVLASWPAARFSRWTVCSSRRSSATSPVRLAK